MSSVWEDFDEHKEKKTKKSKGSGKGTGFTMKHSRNDGGTTHFHLHQSSHDHSQGHSHGGMMMGMHQPAPLMAPMPMPGIPMGMPMGMPMHGLGMGMSGAHVPGMMQGPGFPPDHSHGYQYGGHGSQGSHHGSHESHHSQHGSHHDPPAAQPPGSHHSEQGAPPPDPGPGGPPDDGDGDGSHQSSASDKKKKDPRYKEPRHYGYAGGCFFVAGIPLLIWGAGSELIDRGVPLASDPKTGDAVTIKGFCTHLVKNANDDVECFTWTELAEQQDLPALRGMLKGYATVHNTHIVAGAFCLIAGLLMLIMCFGMKRSKDLKWWMKDIIGWIVLSLVFGSNVLDWTISQSANANGFTSVSSCVRPVTDLGCLVLACIGFWLAARKGVKVPPPEAGGGGGGGSYSHQASHDFGSFGSHHSQPSHAGSYGAPPPAYGHGSHGGRY